MRLGDALQNLGDAKLQKKVNAVVSLLDKTELNMSFYDDFGTARIHLSLDTDGVTLSAATRWFMQTVPCRS